MKRLKLNILIALLVILGTSFSIWSQSQRTSSTTAATIITNARYYLNEPTAVLWSDAELLVWVNEGSTDIAARTHSMVAIDNISLVANQIEYTIEEPSTNLYSGILAVIYINPSSVRVGLIKSNPRSIGHSSASGIPTYWYEIGDKIGIYPKLSTVTTNSIDVYYVERPASVSSGTNILIPAQYDNALIKYVASRAWLKDGQFAKSNRLHAEYLEELDRYRVDYAEQPLTTPEAIK